MDNAEAKLRKRSSLAGEAIRANDQAEVERVIAVLGQKLGLPESVAELELLKKGDLRIVACAALLKAVTAMINEWIAKRLAMGHPALMSQLVYRMRREPKESKRSKEYEKILKSKD
jgi:hypothetical protein